MLRAGLRGEGETAGAGAVEVSLAEGGKSAVTRLWSTAPLRLLAPRNHGHAAWIYSASLGGGLVEGDRIAVAARVRSGAALLLATQASTKVYRSDSVGAAQEVECVVESGALLLSLPDPVACFAGARYRGRTKVSLLGDASALLVESVTCGRRAHGERWQAERIDSELAIEREGKLRALDRQLLAQSDGAVAARLGRFDAFATIIAVGPRLQGLRAQLAVTAPLARRAPLVVAHSGLGDDGCVVRVGAESVEALCLGLRELLAPLPALLGDDPLARRW